MNRLRRPGHRLCHTIPPVTVRAAQARGLKGKCAPSGPRTEPSLAESAQRNSYLKAQVEAVHRNLRFLEVVATSPIGLVTDLKSLREALPEEMTELPDEERDRQAFLDVTSRGKDPRREGLLASQLAKQTIEMIDALTPDCEEALSADWTGRAAKVLARVTDRLGRDIRQVTAAWLDGIYVIVDPEHTNGRTVIDVASAALSGGACAVQLRDKSGSRGAILQTARRMQELCTQAEAIFIMNDWVDIAALVAADGVHVGQKDIPVDGARGLLNAGQIVGTSNALQQEALDSESEGADYIAVGAMFPTGTKQDTRPAGVETLRQVKASVGVPVIAIGGINAGNIGEIADAGADSACVATAVTMADHPEAATRELTSLFRRD
jgi:thiamine-phosphate pyrophosphorylase